MNITNDEWLDISRDLECHHALFYQLWNMGKPVFTEDIPTACVSFNQSGEFIEFRFNPIFWATLTHYERCFVICHECLHIVLNHGRRTIDTKDPPRTNIALDLVVNHLLERGFGFERVQIKDSDQFCWTNTVFNTPTPTDESFEFYYQLVTASPVLKIRLVDCHDKLNEDWSKVWDKLNDSLTNEEKEILKIAAKGGSEGRWELISVAPVKKKQRWEQVIKKWAKKFADENNDEQWARLSRRFALLPNNLFLPSEMEEDLEDKRKINVFLMLDTSGSCRNFQERFWRAGLSLPKDRFNVRLFNFDTKVYETSFESGKIYGGAGTSFRVIEKFLRTCDVYPHAVFVITDGYGDRVNPLYPERWYWFLTPHSSKTFIHAKSKFFNLEDFE